jgi:polyhydroxyalkanoate synthase
VGDFDAWVAKATENPGSWWPHWQRWIERLDNQRVPARRAAKKLKAMADAPGDYVRVKA